MSKSFLILGHQKILKSLHKPRAYCPSFTVQKILNYLNPYHMISIRMLKLCGATLRNPFSIFKSIESMEFSTGWNKVNVIAVYKKVTNTVLQTINLFL